VVAGSSEQQACELEALATYLQSIAEKEKAEFARRLHDELGGLLTAAKMDLSWLQGRVSEPALQQRLQQLGAALDEAMDVKRRVVEQLRPSLLEHFGLQTAVRAYIESVSSKAGLGCELTISAEDEVPKEVAIALFRVVQEGLSNVIRHAGARRIRLLFARDAQGYVLQLADDGCGMNVGALPPQDAHGLASMRHRVRALGGAFSVESEPGAGTALQVRIPRPRTPPAQ
jgi:signal transduction histidine kinase